MKLNESTVKVEREGVAQERSYGIKFSAKAAHILSNALYSNKIGAVVRELSTNAHDAHIQAGKPTVPFRIVLPSQWEQSFEVRDEGPGLDEDDVLTMYTTYFESTKADSNDQTGAFGLGSKSPFAYTDAFTVVSCHGGMKKTYSAFKNEEGMFSMAKLSEVPTNETGLHVKVPVRPSDTSRFVEEAKAQLEYFDPMPIFGGQKIEFPKRHVVKQGTQWKVFKNDSWGGAFQRVKMGCVSYPLDRNLLDPAVHRCFNEMSVLFEVKMGDIDLTPSREGIDYNPRTKKYLTQLVHRAENEFFKDIDDKFAACTTKWEATILWNDLCGYGGPLYGSQHHRKFKWKGEELSNNISWSVPRIKFDAAGRPLSTSRKWDIGFRQISMYMFNKKHKSISDAWSDYLGVTPSATRKIYIVDTPTYYPELAYLNSQTPFEEDPHLVKGAQADIDEVLTLVGWPKANIHRTSDIVVPKAAKQAIVRTAKVLKWDGRWADTTLDYGTGQGQFVYLYKKDIWDKPKADGGKELNISPHSIQSAVSHYHKAGRLTYATFYGIPGSYHDQFKRASGWTDVRLELTRLINEDARAAGLSDVLAQYQANKAFLDTHKNGVDALKELQKHNANIRAKAVPFFDAYANTKKSLTKTETEIVTRALDTVVEILPTKQPVVDLQKEWDALGPAMHDLIKAIQYISVYHLDKDPWRTVISMIQP